MGRRPGLLGGGGGGGGGGGQHHGQQQVKYNIDNGGHYGASAAVCFFDFDFVQWLTAWFGLSLLAV